MRVLLFIKAIFIDHKRRIGKELIKYSVYISPNKNSNLSSQLIVNCSSGGRQETMRITKSSVVRCGLAIRIAGN